MKNIELLRLRDTVFNYLDTDDPEEVAKWIRDSRKILSYIIGGGTVRYDSAAKQFVLSD